MSKSPSATRSRSRPRKLPTALLKEIGALILAASAVDNQVGLQIIRMISPLHFVVWHAFPVVSGMDFKVKLSLVRGLASMQPKDERDYIVECCDEMQKLYIRRNQVAHGVTNGIAADDGTFRFYSFKVDSKTGAPQPPLAVTAAQINEWGRKLVTWSNELEQSLSDLGFPYEAPTEDDVGARPPEAEREEHRPRSRTPRTTRKRPRPPVRE